LKLGLMEEGMKVILRMARRMEKAHLSGQTALSILAAGSVGNNTAQGYYMTLRRTLKSKANGVMARDSDGCQVLKCFPRPPLPVNREFDDDDICCNFTSYFSM
jgi:hypothetical protein